MWKLFIDTIFQRIIDKKEDSSVQSIYKVTGRAVSGYFKTKTRVA